MSSTIIIMLKKRTEDIRGHTFNFDECKILLSKHLIKHLILTNAKISAIMFQQSKLLKVSKKLKEFPAMKISNMYLIIFSQIIWRWYFDWQNLGKFSINILPSCFSRKNSYKIRKYSKKFLLLIFNIYLLEYFHIYFCDYISPNKILKFFRKYFCHYVSVKSIGKNLENIGKIFCYPEIKYVSYNIFHKYFRDDISTDKILENFR